MYVREQIGFSDVLKTNFIERSTHRTVSLFTSGFYRKSFPLELLQELYYWYHLYQSV